MEVMRSTEASFLTRTTRQHIPEDDSLHTIEKVQICIRVEVWFAYSSLGSWA
jgi:hypothetical protein